MRVQPEVPLLLVMFRSKPPMNEPHEMLAALSRSPMFLPAIRFWSPAGLEHTSLSGSVSPIIVQPPWPSAMACVAENIVNGLLGMIMPLVWPEIRLIAPGVDGPNCVVHELSFIAK